MTRPSAEPSAGRSVRAPATRRASTAAPQRVRRNRRWTEENIEPPVDLRLVPMAAATWAGCIVSLLAGAHLYVAALRWVAVLLGLMGVLLLVRRRHRESASVRWTTRCRFGGAVGLVALAAGVLMAGEAVRRAADDLLTDAAEYGRFAALVVEIDAAPAPLESTFAVGDDETGSVPSLRYRIAATVLYAEVAGRQWTADAPVSVVGSGELWRAVIPGERVRAVGLLGPDTFPVIPSVQLRATGPPVSVRSAVWWQSGAAGIRADLRERADRLGGDPAGLLPGLVVGDTSGIDDRLTADAKATGLTHLLAVSGSHFAIVCGTVIALLRRIGPRFAVICGAVVLLGLVILVGPAPSVLRAAVMGGIGVFAVILGRARTALPALAAAVVGLLILDPQLALSAGFALSVQATAGLVLLAPVWSKALQNRGFPRGWADLLAVPLAASVATLPVIAALSGSVSLAAIPTNILVAVVVPPALIIGLLCALAGPLTAPAADLLAAIDIPLLNWIGGVAHTLARAPDATVSWPSTLPWVLLLTGALIMVLGALRHRRIRAVVGAALAGAAVILLPAQALPSPGWPPPGWLVAGCEVGQGDAFVVATDDPGTALVVDAGPDPGLVAGCLDRLRIGTVPLLVLTHLHADHVDGLAGVLAGRSIGMIGVGPGRDPTVAWSAVLKSARSRGIPVVQLYPGSRWAAAGLAIQVLAPEREFVGTDSDPNNDSVVLMAERAGVRMLMAGDIELEAQRALLHSGADLDADVLKVPHHGSAKDSPEFLAAVSPVVAMIGVGLGNDYGHPSPALLQRLGAAGVADIERTDTQGDIAVCLIDGRLADVHRGAALRAP